MADEQVTVEIQADVRNPDDKLTFPLFAVVDPDKKMIEYIYAMYPGEVTRQFQVFAKSGSLTMAHSVVDAADSVVLHKFFSLWRTGETVHKIKLSAKNPRITYPYATLSLSDAKITKVRPVEGDSGRTFYLINCFASGSNGVVVYGQ